MKIKCIVADGSNGKLKFNQVYQVLRTIGLGYYVLRNDAEEIAWAKYRFEIVQ